MKRKVKGKVLKRIVRKKVRICYFCGKSATSRHHVIPKRIGGKGLRNNQVDMCDNCHKKLHAILDNVIDYLLVYIQEIQKTKETKTRPIGFLRNGYDKGGKRNEKEKKTKK